MEEFKYVGVLLTSEDRSEREISRRIGVSSATVTVLVHFGEEKAEPESITLNLGVDLHSSTDLWS